MKAVSYLCLIVCLGIAFAGQQVAAQPLDRVDCPAGLWVEHHEDGYRGLYKSTAQDINGQPVFVHENLFVPEGSRYSKAYIFRHTASWVIQPVTPDPSQWLSADYTDKSDPWSGGWQDSRLTVQCREPRNQAVDWNRDNNMRAHRTELFIPALEQSARTDNWGLVVRRGSTIALGSTLAGIPSSIVVRNRTAHNNPLSSWQVQNHRIQLSADMPVGEYEVQEPAALAGVKVVVLFNPHLQGTPEYFPEDEQAAQFWIYSANSGFSSWLPQHGATYQSIPLEHYRPVVLRSVLRLLKEGARPGGAVDLASPWSVLRGFTWLINDRENPGERIVPAVAHAQWRAQGRCPGEVGSMGCQAMALKTVGNWFEEWEKLNRALWVANCEFMGSIYCASSRMLGVPCRLVHGRQVGQEELPSDGVLDVHPTIGSATDVNGNLTETRRTAGNNALWDYHVWSEVHLNSSPLDDVPGWYMADATPGFESAGRFQTGPAPLRSIRGDEGSTLTDPVMSREVEALATTVRGYTWMGRARVRSLFQLVSDQAARQDLYNSAIDVSFAEWKANGFSPQSYACFLNACLTLDGYEGEAWDQARSFGHIYTQAKTCSDEHMEQRGQSPGAITFPPVGECLMTTTHLYKQGFSDGPNRGIAWPAPTADFAAMRASQSCSCNGAPQQSQGQQSQGQQGRQGTENRPSPPSPPVNRPKPPVMLE